MRMLAGLCVVLLGFGRAYAEAPLVEPTILSYGEVMQLSTEARIAYLSDLGELLALMEEKFQGRYELVATDDARRTRDHVAALIRMINLMPDASAEMFVQQASITDDYSRVKPEWTGQDYACGNGRNVKFVPRFGTCVAVPPNFLNNSSSDPTSYGWKSCPKGTHATEIRSWKGWLPMGAYNCIPQASWDVLNDMVKKKLDKGSTFDEGAYAKMTPEQKAAQVGVPITAEPGGLGSSGAVGANGAGRPQPGSESGGPNCKTPPTNSAEYKKLVDEFRREAKAEKCIAGGFFTDKKQNMTKAACDKKRVFPDHPVGPQNNQQLVCDPNEVLCNPVTFCLQVKGVSFTDKEGKKHSTDVLQSLCVKDTPRLTRDCNKKYKARIAGTDKISGKKAAFGDAAKKKTESCDPATLDIPFLKGQFMDEYRKLRADTEQLYGAHCTGNDKSFLPLFCEECKIVNARLQKMPKPRAQNNAPAATPPAVQGTNPGDAAR